MQVKHVLRETGVVLAAGLLYGSAAFAQSSVILGTVINTEDKKPAADVVVTATSPNLQGEQTVVTDAQGNYRIPQLPPGTYTLRFEKETFKPYARPEIQLLLNRTIRVNVELLPDSFTSTVDVIGSPPTIDVGSTNTGVNVDQEFIKRIVNASPLSIEFVQDVNIITGGYMPEFGRSTGGVINAVTRSGSNEFHGSVFANWTPGFAEGNRKLVIEDGTTITGLNALSNLGDFGATLGGPILKDKLWFFAGFTPAFQRYEHTRALNAFTLNDAGDDVATDENGFSVVREIPGSQRKYFADSRTIQYMGKLTYLINQDHNVSFALNGTPTVSGGLGKLSISPRTGGLPAAQTSRPEDIGQTENRANSTGLALKYAGAFMDKKVLIDANAGWFHQTASTPPADGSAIGDTTGLAGYALAQYTTTRPLSTFENVPNAAEFCGTTAAEQELRCPATNYLVGGPGFMSEATLDRYQINAKGTYLLNALGTHVFKAGVDTEFLTYDQKKAYSGSVFWAESAASYNGATVPIWSDNRRYGYQTAPDTPVFETLQATSTKSTTIGGFLQDSWSIANRVTLNLGVRYDVQSMYGGDGNLALQLGNQWSPRLGAVLDPFANGR
ncbi:MAG: TonB-dependent receptor, partial [Myxococcaceae bacterium]